MSFWRVHSAARRDEVNLAGLWHGATAFLMGANPKVLQLPLHLLNMQGVWVMGINNAAMIVETNAFICVDVPQCFNYNIFTNPRILKLCSYDTHDYLVEGQKIREFPQTLFYDSDPDVTPETFCSPTGPIAGWRNTFFNGLHVLYQLGFKKIHLLGCVFEIEEDQPYAYEHDLSEELVDTNAKTYDKALDVLGQLAPRLEDEGIQLSTCHEGTSLDGMVPYVRFEDAVGECVSACSSIRSNKLIHCYERD